MSVARWLSAIALLLALVVSAAIVLLRDHPAAEHTRSFRDEDKAARALLAALRSRDAAAIASATSLLGDKTAWVTVHSAGANRKKAVALNERSAAQIAAKLDDDDVLQIDVALRAPIAASLIGPLALGVDPGLDGVTLPSGEVVPPGVLLARGLSRGKLAHFVLNENAKLGVRTYALVETRATEAAGAPAAAVAGATAGATAAAGATAGATAGASDASGARAQQREAKRLLLGALLPEAPVDDARLVRAASLGGTYLAAHTKRDNRFDYEIDASNGKASSGYNAVRHAGTTYAMLQLHRQQSLLGNADATVLEAADKALLWLLDKTITDPTDPTRAFQADGKKVKLGGGALTLMAFVERLHVTSPAPHPDMETKAAQLARYLVSQQDADGRFASYYAPSDAYEADARDSIYYPGEAALALARYAALETSRGRDGSHWRAAAERGARFLVDDRHTALGVRVRMPVDAWLLLAIELLDRSAPGGNGYAAGDHLLAHADRITRQIMREQYVEESVPLPMRGARADTDFGSLVSTGSRMEALAAAAALEKRHAPSATRVRGAAIANAAYGMRYQFVEDRMFLTSPRARALGGVPNSVTDPRIRIDGVQHNMSGWLLLAAVLAGRELP